MARHIEPLRLGVSLVAGLALAAAAGLHAASAIATRTDPQVAADLFFANAEAREMLVFDAFTQLVEDPAALTAAAESVRENALDVFKSDPTSAKALALLALARDDFGERHSASLAASRINRRDLALQGLVLDAHLAAKDLPAAVETLDQILRVHPNYLQQFAPLLSEALREERGLPAIARLVDGSSPWHKYYFGQHAIQDPSLLPNLAILRARRPLADENFDSELVRRLAQEGHLAEARALFDQLTGGRETVSASKRTQGRVLGWDSRFPPFDWQFVDTGDMRGQASLEGSELEIFVRPGRGGALAERVLDMPQEPFALEARVAIEGTHRGEAVRAELSCERGGTAFASKDLTSGENTILVANPPQCDQLAIAIHARAWSGGTALRGRIEEITIGPAR